MNNTVTHSVNFAHSADDTIGGVNQSVEHSLDCFGVSGHSHVHCLKGFLAIQLGLVGELTVDADTLA